MYPVNDVTVCGSFNWCLICRDRFTFEGAGLLVCAAAMSAVERNSESADSSNDEYEDARDSPLERRISDSVARAKEGGNIFSLVPSGVPTYRAQFTEEESPHFISSPDSFQDFFSLLSAPKPKSHRHKLPFQRDRSTYNLWSILKNLVGKDVTKIALPVHLNEPLSFCQRLVEDIEYVELLDKAAAASTVHKRLSYLAALASSCFVTTLSRHSKPFNPLLGETYELVNQEAGYCLIAEQVSHHPPVTALYAEGDKWVFWEEYNLDIKFRGQWVRIQPNGLVHFRSKVDGHHFSWNKPYTTVHNLILGSLWADHEGEVVVKCHQSGDKAVVNFTPYSRAKERYRELHGQVLNAQDKVQYILHGAWDKGMNRRRPDGGALKEIWRANEPLPNSEQQYGFTQLAMTLNEEDETVTCPTDSRRRPDQRLLEESDVDAASSEKFRLEEKQRVARRAREACKEKWKPRWFDSYDDSDTNTTYHAYNGKYWEAKLQSDWSQCPDIF